MALLTPLGPLDQLDIENWEVQKDLLSMDKHRLLEGLAIEGTMDSIFKGMPPYGARPLPLSLLRSVQRGRPNSWWIWNHEPRDPGASRLFDMLESRNPKSVMMCDYDESQRDFVISRYFKRIGESVQKRLMAQRRLGTPSFESPAPLLQETLRVLTAFFRITEGTHDRDMFRDVVLHRLFKNCAIQPFYDFLWDIDTILEMPDGRLVQLEIKHKYPGGRDSLFFGLNDGQVRTMLELAKCGIDTFHINVVKPYWDSNSSTGYLMNDPSIRNNILVAGHYLDQQRLELISKGRSGKSGETESLYGKKRQPFKSIPVTEFVRIGTLQEIIAAGPAPILAGANLDTLPPLTQQELLEKRLG